MLHALSCQSPSDVLLIWMSNIYCDVTCESCPQTRSSPARYSTSCICREFITVALPNKFEPNRECIDHALMLHCIHQQVALFNDECHKLLVPGKSVESRLCLVQPRPKGKALSPHA